MAVVGTLAAALTLAACASSTSTSTSTSSAPSSTSSSSTPALTVAEACQTVADELPTDYFPDPAEWSAYGDALRDMGAPDGLLDDLQAAVSDLADDPSGSELLDSRSDMRSALDDLNAECKAAGSDALA